MNSSKSLSMEYEKCRKKKEVRDCHDDELKVIIGTNKIPIAWFSLFEKKSVDVGCYEYDVTTNFRYYVCEQDNAVGQEESHRGEGVMCGEDVTLSGTLLLVSRKSIKLKTKDLKLRKFMQDLGFCFFNKHMFNMEEAINKVNARRAVSSTTVEDVNVVLQILSSDVIENRWLYILPKGYYAIIYNRKPIMNGSFLVVNNYGEKSLMQFGKQNYINAQKQCYRVYESACLESISEDEVVCERCCEVVSKVDHNSCTPYMTNFFEPAPAKKYLRAEDYLRMECAYLNI